MTLVFLAGLAMVGFALAIARIGPHRDTRDSAGDEIRSAGLLEVNFSERKQVHYQRSLPSIRRGAAATGHSGGGSHGS